LERKGEDSYLSHDHGDVDRMEKGRGGPLSIRQGSKKKKGTEPVEPGVFLDWTKKKQRSGQGS